MSRNNQSKSLALMFLLGAFLTGGVLGFAADRVIVSKKDTQPEVARTMTVKEGRDQFARELNLDVTQRVFLDSVLDWRNGVRGPCNLIGQGYGDASYSEAECVEMLGRFESGDLEVSQRNWVPIRFTDESASITAPSLSAGDS